MQQIRARFTDLLSWIDLTITAGIMLSCYGTMAGLAAVMSSTASELGWFATLVQALRSNGESRR